MSTNIQAMQSIQNAPVAQIQASVAYPFITSYIAMKEQMIREIESVVERYEKKRAKEENALHTMSPLRRMFAGRKPDHHLAVEYIHYVRKPMEQARKIRTEIEIAQTIMNQTKPSDLIIVPDDFLKFTNR